MASLNNGAGFEDDSLDSGCYSQLLLADDFLSLETDGCLDFNNSPKMLCFGDPCNMKTGQESELTCTGSDPVFSRKTKISTLINVNDGSGSELIEDPGVNYGPSTRGERQSNKKLKLHNSRVINRGHAKVAKKEKLGERITALQKLVSPFGKTDTASVLHEALGYIRFLQDQVNVLCSPYLQGLPPSSPTLHNLTEQGNGENRESESKKDDLRSRGLCLVPVDFTLHVAESNGADLWSSAAMLNNVSSN